MKILLLILNLGTLTCNGSPMYGYPSGTQRPLAMDVYFEPAPAQIRGYGNMGYRGYQDTGLAGAGYTEPPVQETPMTVQETPMTGAYAGKRNGYRFFTGALAGILGMVATNVATNVLTDVITNAVSQG